MYIFKLRIVFRRESDMTERVRTVREKFHNLGASTESDCDWEPIISIGTAAAKVGLSVSAIRKYEAEGLLIYDRTPTGRRLLSRSDLRRIEIIRHMIYDLGLNMVGIRRLLALLPCWHLRPCDDDEKVSCRVVAEPTRPCWMVREAEGGSQGRSCRDCPVYRYGAYCTEAIKSLLYNLNEKDDEN
jgi:MerR family transcriptional regulator/heat shock protein HspR